MVTLAAGVLMLAGCSTANGAADATSGNAQAAPTAAGAADMSAWVQCLVEHGVQMPSGGPRGALPGSPPSGSPTDRPSDAALPSDRPTGGPGGAFPAGPGGATGLPPGVDEQAWQSAQQACAGLAPTRPTQPSQDAAGNLNAFWSCMADHDVQAPDSRLPNDLDQNDPTVTDSLDTCRVLIPQP